ncbi:response regulator [Mariniphaga sp.]|uniref:response regulator n=1 Tax=Mariniphaga sp. TaxID=1954475 RepID=UPI00356746EF
MTEKAILTKKNTILIVEDDETSSILLQVFLSQGNHKLLYAEDGKMAVQMFRDNPNIDLILMDLKMPVMDGYEATRQIKKINANIPIIAQSAYAMSGDSEKALEAGCDDYVTKPVKKEELLAKIKTLLK